MDADSKAQLVLLADSLGLAGQAHSTGWVSAEEFTDYIQAADVCVQLRYPTFGETSASVLRALAAGTPCITSDQGPMAELPDDVVPKVRSPHHEVADLTAILGELFANPDHLAELGERGRRHVVAQHHPAHSTETYATVIEQTIARRARHDANWRETTGWLLESGPLLHDERERLSVEWAALREGMRTQMAQSTHAARTAA
jgi:glycosyltransferase involved in cell wall biosynthesis